MTKIQKAIEAALIQNRLMSIAEIARATGYSYPTVTKYLRHPRFVQYGREGHVYGRPPMLYTLAPHVEEPPIVVIEPRVCRAALEAVAAEQLALAALIRAKAQDNCRPAARKLAEVWVMEEARFKSLCDRS